MTESSSTEVTVSASKFLQSLFQEELRDQTKHDPEVVSLVKQHLCQGSLHTRAGARLADALIQLGKARAKESGR